MYMALRKNRGRSQDRSLVEAELQKSFKLAEDVQWLHVGGHGAFTVPLDRKLAVVDSSVDSAFLVGEGGNPPLQ